MKKSRYKINNSEITDNKTPLRQRSIPECFKCTKPKPYKMETPIPISSVCNKINSSREFDHSQFGYRDAPSSPKRLKITTETDDARASTPITSSPVTPQSSTVKKTNTPNEPSMNLSTDATFLNKFGQGENNWNDDAVPCNNNHIKSSVNSDDAMDSFPSQGNNTDQSQSSTSNVSTSRRRKPVSKKPYSKTATSQIKNTIPLDSTTIKKISTDVSKTNANQNEAIDKVLKNKELLVIHLSSSENYDISQNSNRNEIATPVQKSTIRSSSATPKNSPGKKTKTQLTTSNQTVKSNSSKLTPRGDVKLQENPTISTNGTLDKVVSSEVNYQQPCSATNEQNMASTKKEASTGTSKKNRETLQKQKMGPNTPVKGSNPKRLNSPTKDKPTQNKTTKALESKGRKQLQFKQKETFEKALQTFMDDWRLRSATSHVSTPRRRKPVLKKTSSKTLSTKSQIKNTIPLDNTTIGKTKKVSTDVSETNKNQNEVLDKLRMNKDIIVTPTTPRNYLSVEDSPSSPKKSRVNDPRTSTPQTSLLNDNMSSSTSTIEEDNTLNGPSQNIPTEKETNTGHTTLNQTVQSNSPKPTPCNAILHEILKPPTTQNNVDNQRPSCSELLGKESSSRDKQDISSAKPDTSTSKKISTPIKSRNPKRPKAIKTSKSKEEKQHIQDKKMAELVKLFKIVTNNRHLSSLLDKDEISILNKFLNLEEKTKHVFLELIVSKRQYYNFQFCLKATGVDNHNDVTDIIKNLRQEQFVNTDYKISSSLSVVLNSLKVTTLKEVMEDLHMEPEKDKGKNIARVKEAAKKTIPEDIIWDAIEKKFGHAFMIKDNVYKALFNIYHLATFANPNFYSMSQYFRYIFGSKRAPKFQIEEYTVFYTRVKFINYGEAMEKMAELDERVKSTGNKFFEICRIGKQAYEKLCNLKTNNTDDHQEAPHLKRFTAEYIYSEILSKCCENNRHPKVKTWLEYLIKEFPSSRKLGKWYNELICWHMLHFDVINYREAAELLIEVLGTKNSMLSEIAIYDLVDLAEKLKSRRNPKLEQLDHDRLVHVMPRPIDSQKFPLVHTGYECFTSEKAGKKRKSNFEEVILHHYADYGYPKHCEGGVIKALLMLYFWDIFYNETEIIPATLINNLQLAPLDMFTPYFYKNRKNLIDQRLMQIDSQWPEEELISFAAKSLQNHSRENTAFGMIMNTITDDVTVKVLVTVIGRTVLKKIVERLIKNLEEFSNGMPDLLVWNDDEKKCKFVNIKRGKLSTGQKLWLKYLQDNDASIEVLMIHVPKSKYNKSKKDATKNVEQQKEPSETNQQDD